MLPDPWRPLPISEQQALDRRKCRTGYTYDKLFDVCKPAYGVVTSEKADNEPVAETELKTKRDSSAANEAIQEEIAARRNNSKSRKVVT